jgi:hypothetical protein
MFDEARADLEAACQVKPIFRAWRDELFAETDLGETDLETTISDLCPANPMTRFASWRSTPPNIGPRMHRRTSRGRLGAALILSAVLYPRCLRRSAIAASVRTVN